MITYYFGQTAFQLLLTGPELDGCTSITDWIVSEPTPLIQFPVMNGAARWLRVIDGAVIVTTNARTYTLTARSESQELFVPSGTRAHVRNAAAWLPSRLMIVTAGLNWERFLSATAAERPGVPPPDDLAETAARYGIEAEIIKPGEPVVTRCVIPRPRTAAEAI